MSRTRRNVLRMTAAAVAAAAALAIAGPASALVPGVGAIGNVDNVLVQVPAPAPPAAPTENLSLISLRPRCTRRASRPWSRCPPASTSRTGSTSA
jgi:hypothetical protein